MVIERRREEMIEIGEIRIMIIETMSMTATGTLASNASLTGDSHYVQVLISCIWMVEMMRILEFVHLHMMIKLLLKVSGTLGTFFFMYVFRFAPPDVT